MSEKGRISYCQAFSNAGDSIQEALCHLDSVPLESTVTDALEENICKLYKPVSDIIRLTELRWWIVLVNKKLNCINYIIHFPDISLRC